MQRRPPTPEPTPWDPHIPARVVAALAVLALAGVSVLAVRWDDPGTRLTAAGAPVPSTVAPTPTAPTATSVPASTTSTSVASTPTLKPTSTSAPAKRTTKPVATRSTTATTAAVTIHPGALRRPAAGRYAIRVAVGDTSTDGTLTIDAEQWQRRAVGPDTRIQNLVWDRDGALLYATGEPGADGACTWDHELLQVPTDLAEGRTWSSKGTCESTIAGRAVHIERVETAEVSGRARSQLGGRSVDTWVIDRRVVVSIEGNGISTITDATSRELFAPELGLPVFQASQTKVPQQDGSVPTVDGSEELLGLAAP